MNAVLSSTTLSAWLPVAPAVEARFEPMTPERLDAVLAIEQSVYSHPWTRGNFADWRPATTRCA
jgi:ribosomal-protein-alanine N-acetyltransferase